MDSERDVLEQQLSYLGEIIGGFDPSSWQRQLLRDIIAEKCDKLASLDNYTMHRTMMESLVRIHDTLAYLGQDVIDIDSASPFVVSDVHNEMLDQLIALTVNMAADTYRRLYIRLGQRPRACYELTYEEMVMLATEIRAVLKTTPRDPQVAPPWDVQDLRTLADDLDRHTSVTPNFTGKQGIR